MKNKPTYIEVVRLYFPDSCELPENYDKHDWIYLEVGFGKKRICTKCGLSEYIYTKSIFKPDGERRKCPKHQEN